MDNSTVLVYENDDVKIIWDKEERNFYYESPDYSARICMYVIGNFDLEVDEYEAIQNFIGERV